MRFRSFRYFLREALASLFKNRLMSLASIITVSSCIFMVALSYTIAVNVDSFLSQLEGQIGLSVFLLDDLPQAEVRPLQEAIQFLPNVMGIDYVSEEEARRRFMEHMGWDDPRLVGGLDDMRFPRSFDIMPIDINLNDQLIADLYTLMPQGIDYIRYDQGIIETFSAINTGIRIVSLIVILCLIIISIIIIVNTIKITVSNRRTEVFIMKYIGATDWFIRWPFIIEGVLIGVVGTVIAITICWFGYNSIVYPDSEHVAFIAEFVELQSGVYVFAVLFPLTLILGAGIGAIGSIASLRKYLQV
jgi:cell division transport system permease protein